MLIATYTDSFRRLEMPGKPTLLKAFSYFEERRNPAKESGFKLYYKNNLVLTSKQGNRYITEQGKLYGKRHKPAPTPSLQAPLDHSCLAELREATYRYVYKIVNQKAVNKKGRSDEDGD